MNVTMRKISSDTLTAQVKAYSFMSPIKGTPANRKKFMKDVMEIVKQLGIPTFF